MKVKNCMLLSFVSAMCFNAYAAENVIADTVKPQAKIYNSFHVGVGWGWMLPAALAL